MPQARLGEIDIALDIAEHFVIDDVLIPQDEDRLSFCLKCFIGKSIIGGGKNAQGFIAVIWIVGLELPETVFVLNAKPSQTFEIGGIEFFFQVAKSVERSLIRANPRFAFFTFGASIIFYTQSTNQE